jgi:hypothetical protein
MKDETFVSVQDPFILYTCTCGYASAGVLPPPDFDFIIPLACRDVKMSGKCQIGTFLFPDFGL